MRGAGAVMILAHHFGFGTDVTRAFGDCAVSIFLMLSGFVLALAYWPSFAHGRNLSPGQFMLKRLARIYPLYLLTLMGMCLLYWPGTGPVAADLLLLQSWVPETAYYFSGNGPAWFLSTLMFGYMMFVPLLRLRRLNPKVADMVLIAVLALYLGVVGCGVIPADRELDLIYVFPPMQLPVFAIGVFLGCRCVERQSATLGGRWVVAAFLLTAGAIYAWRFVPGRFALCSYWWIPSAVLITAVYLNDTATGMVRKMLGWGPLVRFGDISFSFYIIHWPWLVVSRIAAAKAGLDIPLGVEFAVQLVVITLLSWGVARWFERPVVAWLDGMIAGCRR